MSGGTIGNDPDLSQTESLISEKHAVAVELNCLIATLIFWEIKEMESEGFTHSTKKDPIQTYNSNVSFCVF